MYKQLVSVERMIQDKNCMVTLKEDGKPDLKDYAKWVSKHPRIRDQIRLNHSSEQIATAIKNNPLNWVDVLNS